MKKALITGAGAGFGNEAACRIADKGFDIIATVRSTRKSVVPFERRRPVRKPFPEHLPRERFVIPSSCSCPACGGSRLSKLGEDVTETLEVYVRDDAPFAGADRRGEHPQAHLASWSGIFQADAYGGYGELYRDGRDAGPVLEAGCFAHARRRVLRTRRRRERRP